MAATRILVFGGGGFSMGDLDSPLDRYLLGLTDRPTPRLCFVPTASGDAEAYIERFEAAFSGRCETSVLSLFRRRGDLRAQVLSQDIIFVGGGSTANLLALWRLHGLDRLLVEAAAAGTVLAGISAGMNCWFESSVTDSFDMDGLDPLPDGLGLLPGSACPHYDGEPLRRPTYTRLVAEGVLPAGYAVHDDCALLFEDGRLTDAVSSRVGAGAFRVRREGTSVSEEPVAVRSLATEYA